MAECEWDDDLPGGPCGADDVPTEATTTRDIFWSNRIWGGEGEDWVEKTALCDAHAKAFDDAVVEREAATIRPPGT